MKKYEKEFVAISTVPTHNGGELKKVEMLISQGKLNALEYALLERDTEVSKDLLAMLQKAM